MSSTTSCSSPSPPSSSFFQVSCSGSFVRLSANFVLLFFTFAVWCCIQLPTASTQQVGVCTSLANVSFCADILSPAYRSSVFIPTSLSSAFTYWSVGNKAPVCQQTADETISGFAPVIWAAVEENTNCMNHLAKFLCATSYPSCSYTTNQTLLQTVSPLPLLAIPSFPDAASCLATVVACQAYAPFLAGLPTIGPLFSNATATCGASSYPLNLIPPPLPNSDIQRAIQLAVKPLESFVPSNVPRPKCMQFNSTVCGDVVDYEIYQPAFVSTGINPLDPIAREADLEAVNYLYYTAPFATNCAASMKKHLCTRSFLRCQRNVISNSFGTAIATLYNKMTGKGTIPPAPSNVTEMATVFEEALAFAGVPPSTLQVPFPGLPCQLTCDYFDQAACAGFLQQLLVIAGPAAVSLLGNNCSSTGTYIPAAVACGVEQTPALPDYPLSSAPFATLSTTLPAAFSALLNLPSTVVLTLNVTLAADCNYVGINLQPGANITDLAAYSDSQPLGKFVQCPAPLVNWDVDACSLGGGACAVPCPLPLFTREEQVSISRAYMGCAITSFITTTFFLTTWLLFHEKRDQIYVTNFAFVVWVLAFEALVSTYQVNGKIDDMMNIGCKNNCQPWGYGDHSYCTFQGVMSHILVVAVTSWFFVLCADLWMKVRLKLKVTQLTQKIKHVIAFSVGYGPSFIAVFIGLGLEEFGASGYLPFCFANSTAGNKDVGTAYSPSLFMCFLGFWLIMDVTYLLIKNAKNVNSMSSGGAKKKISRWSVHLRPLLFLIQILVVLIFFEANRFDQVQFTDTLTADVQLWVQCLLGPGGSTARCGDVPNQNLPNRPLTYLLMVAAGGIGALLSFTHGTNPDVFRLWYALLFRCQTSLISRSSIGSTGSASGNPNANGSTQRPTMKKSMDARGNSVTTPAIPRVASASSRLEFAIMPSNAFHQEMRAVAAGHDANTDAHNVRRSVSGVDARTSHISRIEMSPAVPNSGRVSIRPLPLTVATGNSPDMKADRRISNTPIPTSPSKLESPSFRII